jgi:hydroxymethylglutaryl-CoA lyase
MGVDTGVDLMAVVETAWFISERIGRMPVSKAAKAMQATL